MTRIHRDTIMRLGVRIGQGCARLLDEKMRGLTSTSIQVDEIWGFVGRKDKNVKPTDDTNAVGSVWTFCAIDSETTNAFMTDLASRLKNRIQLASDGFAPYLEAHSASGARTSRRLWRFTSRPTILFALMPV
jgi:hypothetical protein